MTKFYCSKEHEYRQRHNISFRCRACWCRTSEKETQEINRNYTSEEEIQEMGTTPAMSSTHKYP